MESYRLKNIILLILVLVNLFLLGSLSSRYAQETGARETALAQITALYEGEGLALEAAIPSDKATAVLALERDSQQDRLLAAFFLGEELSEDNEGGGIITYTSDLGTAVFSSGGKYDMELQFTPRSIKDFCQEFCRTFRYSELDFSQLENDTGEVTALQYFDERPVVNCGVSFRFVQGELQSVSGQQVPPVSSSSESRDCIDALTALSAFLEYWKSTRPACTAVTEIALGYERQSSPAAPLSLVPVWRLRTDGKNGEFYVNCTTKEVLSF